MTMLIVTPNRLCIFIYAKALALLDILLGYTFDDALFDIITKHVDLHISNVCDHSLGMLSKC